jgi:hypothetical protein
VEPPKHQEILFTPSEVSSLVVRARCALSSRQHQAAREKDETAVSIGDIRTKAGQSRKICAERLGVVRLIECRHGGNLWFNEVKL